MLTLRERARRYALQSAYAIHHARYMGVRHGEYEVWYCLLIWASLGGTKDETRWM
jgi:hypothetical protein